MRKFLNVLGCIAASLFSIVLVLVVLVFALRNAVSAFTKPTTITQVVQNMDIQQLIPDAEAIKTMLPEDLFGDVGDSSTDKAVDTVLNLTTDLLKSNAMEELFTLYVQDVLASVTQENPEKMLTAEMIKTIVRENIDELTTIVQSYVPETATMEEEVLQTQIISFVDGFAQEILTVLPEITENSDSMTLGELLSGFGVSEDTIVGGDTVLGDMDTPFMDEDGNIVIDAERYEAARTAASGSTEDTPQEDEPSGTKDWAEMDLLSAAIRFLLDPAVTIAFIVALVVLAGIIYGCRFPRFGGLLWLGIDALVVANITVVLAIVLNGSFLYSLIPEELASVITAVTGVLADDLTVTTIVCAVVGVVLIVGFALLRHFVCNRKATIEEETSAVPAIEE